ncbi:MAG TPA: hypothetical protein VII23_05855 [Terriglobales bacterium]|jgi:hypothetical protein
MSGKLTAVLLIVVAAVAFGAGFYLRRPSAGNAGLGKGNPPPPAPKQTKVKIIMKQDLSCQQIDSGSGNADKVPMLNKTVGDTIIWEKGIAPGGPTTLSVTFPQTSNGHPGTPFIDPNTHQPVYTLNDGDIGHIDPNAVCDTYLFQSAKVGANSCTNPQDPGVIIDK